jgi:hypothetical protein
LVGFWFSLEEDSRKEKGDGPVIFAILSDWGVRARGSGCASWYVKRRSCVTGVRSSVGGGPWPVGPQTLSRNLSAICAWGEIA